MKVRIMTENWVRGEVFDADRVEVRFDSLVVEGDGVDILTPFNPGDLEVRIETYRPRGIALVLEDRYRLEGPSGVVIRSFHDGHFEVSAHGNLFQVKVWRYAALRLEEAEAE